MAAQELSGNLVGLDVNSLASVQDCFSPCRERQLVGAQEPKPVGSPSVALITCCMDGSGNAVNFGNF